jgi:hypothetical protein
MDSNQLIELWYAMHSDGPELLQLALATQAEEFAQLGVQI